MDGRVYGRDLYRWDAQRVVGQVSSLCTNAVAARSSSSHRPYSRRAHTERLALGSSLARRRGGTRGGAGFWKAAGRLHAAEPAAFFLVDEFVLY
eukprot:6206961-Pleurochrysis_carterae.AAC.5